MEIARDSDEGIEGAWWLLLPATCQVELSPSGWINGTATEAEQDLIDLESDTMREVG